MRCSGYKIGRSKEIIAGSIIVRKFGIVDFGLRIRDKVFVIGKNEKGNEWGDGRLRVFDWGLRIGYSFLKNERRNEWGLGIFDFLIEDGGAGQHRH
jgi:hypothetical protein